MARACSSLIFLLALGCGDKDGSTDTGALVVRPLSGSLIEDDGPSTEVKGTMVYTMDASVTLTDTTLDGAMQWTISSSRSGDADLCDAEIGLTGTPVSGYCDGCDFAFSVDGTVTEERGSSCAYYAQFNFIEDPIIVNPTLVFFSSYVFEYNGDTYTYTDDLRTGVSVDYTQYGYDYYPGPYYTFIAWDEGGYGSASLSDTGAGTSELSWSWRYTYTQRAHTQYQYCGTYPYNYDYSATAGWGGKSHTSALDCTGEVVDIWEVDLSAGDIFLATVDTVAANSAFDPYLFINGPESCTLGVADDAFPCAFAPTNYSCPAARFRVDEDGTYQVAVGSYGSCTGDSAEYALYLGRHVPASEE